MRWFSKKKYTSISKKAKKKEMPEGLWTKCPSCGTMIFVAELEKNMKICPKCGFYFTLTARERLRLVADEGTFLEMFTDIRSINPLEFPEYDKKLQRSQKKTGLDEAVMCGRAKIEEIDTALGVSDFSFLGGSMGSVVGEKVTLLAEYALEERLPLVVVSAGGGGARMHEGMLSLMQMAKTSAAVARLRKNGIPFISVLTHPTMGGVAASFASLGDVIMAEPKALIGFAGPRVIEQTIHQRLPEGFQTSEFLLEHGMIDMIVERGGLKATLGRTLRLLAPVPVAG
jgi:acetyl-CoA carboxylase carboxyl transferase subunit beta